MSFITTYLLISQRTRKTGNWTKVTYLSKGSGNPARPVHSCISAPIALLEPKFAFRANLWASPPEQTLRETYLLSRASRRFK